ncbi:MAG: hypothetical protein ACKVG1_08460 [Rhodospirillales bacterium]
MSYCARCDVIRAFNKFGGIGSTSSFRGVRGMEDGMEHFQTLLHQPRAPRIRACSGHSQMVKRASLCN